MKVHIEPPRLDWRGKPTGKFLFGVTIQPNEKETLEQTLQRAKDAINNSTPGQTDTSGEERTNMVFRQ